jgi:UDP-glucose 4-epimerase
VGDRCGRHGQTVPRRSHPEPLSRVLVTGGAGFIGSHLTERLLERGDDVVVLDDLSTGVRENVPTEAELVEGDVRDADVVAAAAAGADAVFHVAGQASIFRSFETPERDLAVNVSGTLSVLQACIREHVPRLVYASSMTVYGEPERVPTPEDEPCIPVSYYGVTKYAAERYVQIAGARNDVALATTSLRMFNVYGERQSLTNPYQGVLAIFVGNVLRNEPITIHADGGQTRDFVYVGDVADAWLAVLDEPAAHGRVLNVGSGRETKIADLARGVLSGLGHEGWDIRSAPAQIGDVRRSGADVTALTTVTGWQARTSLDEGLARTLASVR